MLTIDSKAVCMEDPAVSALVTEFEPAAGTLVGWMSQATGYRVRRLAGRDDHLLLLTRDGAGLIRTAAGTVPVPPGTIVHLDRASPQDYGTDPAAGRWGFWYAHLPAGDTLDALLDWPAEQPGVSRLVLDRRIADRVAAALEEASMLLPSPGRHSGALARNALERALLWCETRNPRAQQVDPRLWQVLEHLHTHLAEPLGVPELAEVAGLSPSRLQHLFTDQLGGTVMAHVESRRMERARLLLQSTELPVGVIAAQVGYADPLYFSTRFRLRHGVSPTGWRQRLPRPPRAD